MTFLCRDFRASRFDGVVIVDGDGKKKKAGQKKKHPRAPITPPDQYTYTQVRTGMRAHVQCDFFNVRHSFSQKL